MSEFPEWLEREKGPFWNPSYEEAQELHRQLRRDAQMELAKGFKGSLTPRETGQPPQGLTMTLLFVWWFCGLIMGACGMIWVLIFGFGYHR
jgi:hypothetical protein